MSPQQAIISQRANPKTPGIVSLLHSMHLVVFYEIPKGCIYNMNGLAFFKELYYIIFHARALNKNDLM